MKLPFLFVFLQVQKYITLRKIAQELSNVHMKFARYQNLLQLINTAEGFVALKIKENEFRKKKPNNVIARLFRCGAIRTIIEPFTARF